MKRLCARQCRRSRITWKDSFYPKPTDFVSEAVREKLAAIKAIECRDVDYKTAKKEVAVCDLLYDAVLFLFCPESLIMKLSPYPKVFSLETVFLMINRL
jgi:hypothetical protein